MHEEGADEPGFNAIVGAGPTGSVPHAHPGDRPVGEGETIVIDLGARLAGYTSDCTRTFATGELPDRLREAYDVCAQAQQAGLDAIRAGVSGRDADASARDVVEASPFAGRFGHGLGHGVGMDVHEAPRLSRIESEEPLRVGNAVTVEPGVYLPDELGVRIEDLLVVTEQGHEVLTGLSKDFTVI